MLGGTASVDPVLVGYLVVFGSAALACFASVVRARRIEDPDTRRGLVALLVTSGAWASAHVAFLVAPTRGLKVGVYMVGLVVGIAAVGPWLYFCSAYSGRSLHRNPTLQRVAIGVFLALVALKLTNPVHHLYFTATMETEPFVHLAIDNGPVHWAVMGLSYALAAVGYFMLLELFTQVGYDTRPLAVLVAVTGLPVVLDVVGLLSPALVDITYEPVGVAVFALGVLFVYLDRFEAIRIAGERDEAVIVLSEDGRVREFNDSARSLFPELAGKNVVGEPLAAVLPSVADAVGSDGTAIVELERSGATRYYRVTGSPFAAGQAQLGRLLSVADVTHRERYRRELERQNERLDQFASMVSHDLRNPLNVAQGRIELAREDHDSEHLEHAETALDRMEGLIEDVLTLARQGQPIDEREPVSLAAVAEESWTLVDSGGAELEVTNDQRFEADPERVRQLFENLYRNAVEHGGGEVTVRVGTLDDGDGFFVEDDGPGIPETERRQVFESGYSTAADGTGFGLAIVQEIAEAHGWEVVATESDEGGARFEFRGVE